MPKYTLLHGGLKTTEGFHPAGSEVELSHEQAAAINARGEHVKLSAAIEAEKEAEKKKATAIARINARVAAELEAENKKLEDDEKKKTKGGDK